LGSTVARDGGCHPLCGWGLLADDEQVEPEVVLDVGWVRRRLS
jgi:hypothetical protein